MVKMQDTDRIILKNLRKDARIKMTAISKAEGIPETTVFDRIRYMTRKRIIKKFYASLEFEQLGYNIRLFIAVKEKNINGKNALVESLSNNANINNIKIAEGNLILSELIFQNMMQADDFISLMKANNHNIDHYFITEELKTEEFLP